MKTKKEEPKSASRPTSAGSKAGPALSPEQKKAEREARLRGMSADPKQNRVAGNCAEVADGFLLDNGSAGWERDGFGNAHVFTVNKKTKQARDPSLADNLAKVKQAVEAVIALMREVDAKKYAADIAAGTALLPQLAAPQKETYTLDEHNTYRGPYQRGEQLKAKHINVLNEKSERDRKAGKGKTNKQEYSDF